MEKGYEKMREQNIKIWGHHLRRVKCCHMGLLFFSGNYHWPFSLLLLNGFISLLMFATNSSFVSATFNFFLLVNKKAKKMELKYLKYPKMLSELDYLMEGKMNLKQFKK